MASLYQSVKSCIFKAPEKPQGETTPDTADKTDSDSSSDTASSASPVDKKTDEEPVPQPGLLWRVSGGLYNTASSAVGYGVGGVKWVAGAGYNAGAAVVQKVPKLRKKDKSE